MKTSKFLAIFIAVLSLASFDAFGQKSDKELKKDLRSNVERDCKKTAKSLLKEGWKVMPGKLPLERQIQDARFAELNVDDNGQRLNIVASHQAIGGNYSAAKQICDTRAQAELAQQISSTIAQQVKDQLSSRNLGDGDLELIDQTISATKKSVLAKLSGVSSVLEIFREVDNGKYEVRAVIIVPYRTAIKDAKAALLEQLKNKSESLAQEVDKML